MMRSPPAARALAKTPPSIYNPPSWSRDVTHESRASALPCAGRFYDPCLPSRAVKAPSADGWIHEIKHDGFPLQIHVRSARVRLYTMTGVDWSERYPRIVEDVARLKIAHAILDAECCCDGDNGVTDFDRLMARGHDASAYAYAFDLLAIDDRDVRSEPLEQRKAALANAERISPSLTRGCRRVQRTMERQ